MVNRPAENERRAAERAFVAADFTGHRLSNTVYDSQPQAAAAGGAIAARIETDKRLEYPFAFLEGDTRAIIFHS